jgi:putative salt-induced outer membrane protein
MVRRQILALAYLLLVPGVTLAQDTDPEEPPRWSGTAEVSALATSGNSDTRTFGLGGEVVFDPGTWKWLGRAAYVETEADDVLRARSQSALLEVSRAVSERLDVYGRGGYLRDLFAGIERRIATEAGLAYQVIATGAHTLEVLGGVGFTQEQRSTGDDLSLATANGTGRYAWALTETSALTEEAAFVAALNSGDDWRLTNEIAATAALSSLLSLKVSQKLSYLNRPVPGFRKTDTIFAAALVANF